MTSNEQLQRDVLDELAWDPSVDASTIGVTANEGVVTLTGRVRSYADKLAAERTAKRVFGVHALADDLEVRLPSAAVRGDPEIAAAALSALRWHVSVPDDRIKVMVDDGWVTLEGQVDWQYQKQAAEKAVRFLTGVRGITNAMKVKPRATPSDVKARIEAAMKRTATLEADQLQVAVKDDKVTLKGRVQSWSEREAAERAAWNAPGVVAVENDIVVASLVAY